MLLAVRDVVPAGRLAGHYHDTHGRAMDMIDASLSMGVRVFDSAVGGLGGCPYAPGAAGNVATEKVNAHLSALGYETGLDQEMLETAAGMAQAMRGDAHV
jgi:hydroxymethylglutaryl-CoA lyase